MWKCFAVTAAYGVFGVAIFLPVPARAGGAPDAQHPVPASLAAVAEYGENIYDSAKADEWAKAAEKVGPLKSAAAKLAIVGPGEQKQIDDLNRVIDSLTKAVEAKDRTAAMEAANRVTRIAAELTKPFNPAVPVGVVLLDYYGRELEIGAAAGDRTRLGRTAEAMRKTWNEVRPMVEAHHGDEAAKQFDKALALVESAKSPAEYSDAASKVLILVDELEKVFAK